MLEESGAAEPGKEPFVWTGSGSGVCVGEFGESFIVLQLFYESGTFMQEADSKRGSGCEEELYYWSSGSEISERVHGVFFDSEVLSEPCIV